MKNLIFFFVCLSFNVGLFAQQNIDTLYMAKKYSAVIELVENQDSATVYKPFELYRIGRSFFNEDRHVEALKYFDKALAAGRDSANVHYFKALCLKELKQFDRAYASISEAIKRDSADQDAWAERGQIDWSLDKLDFAVADFEQAVKCKKENASPYFFLFYTHFLKKDYANAEKAYQKWQKDINSDEHYELLGLRIMGEIERDQKKDYKKAATYFQEVLDKDPLSIKSYEDLMIAQTRETDWKKVDKTFEKLKAKYAEKRMNDKDLKRTGAVVDKFLFNDTSFVIVIRYFKKPTEFAEAIYQAYVDDTRNDSTVFTVLTEKSIDFENNNSDNHMLCGRQGSTHFNYIK